MNNRQFDIISLSVDLELMDLLEESDAAWFGERRNYGTRTGNGGDGRGDERREDEGEPGQGTSETQQPTTGQNAIPPAGDVSQATQSPTRSKAPNFYGPPE